MYQCVSDAFLCLGKSKMICLSPVELGRGRDPEKTGARAQGDDDKQRQRLREKGKLIFGSSCSSAIMSRGKKRLSKMIKSSNKVMLIYRWM